ncbi:MLO-like protein 13 isoform X1 [Punica granatum]|uniref:MLO-like protein n=2 Tax=Punica granatum TaxID=22663 RepID=A0A6P8CUI5_PUNGR|nr:MLO-like protein 13 isoform X1 [Punica granatum]
MAVEESRLLQETPTWITAGVSFVIILISLCAERALHRLGKLLKRKGQDALFAALEKLKEELMLLGFISLMLTVFQGVISRICIPTDLISHMLPCKFHHGSEASNPEHQQLLRENTIRRHLLSSDLTKDHCAPKGKVPLLTIEALHQLHIFIFVLAVVHVIFCASTMVLGGLRIRQWKSWEESIQRGKREKKPSLLKEEAKHREIFKQRASGYWRRSAIVSWVISFCTQFYNSVSKSDYIALRQGFIKAHCPSHPDFNFHKYMMRTLQADFKKVVGISMFLWMFVIVFLLLDVEGWHTYFWLSFLPLGLLLLVGAKLEHIITRLAQDALADQVNHEMAAVKPSDEYFWFHRPGIVLHLIHFILFQNSFEIAFFFWILCTYGFHSCMMEKYGYIIPRLIMGVLVQVLCSYSTLPLYVLVTQMGSKFKQGMFDEQLHSYLKDWIGDIRDRDGLSNPRDDSSSKLASSIQPKAHKLVKESWDSSQVSEHCAVIDGSDMHDTEDSALP